MSSPICPYCSKPAALLGGRYIYPRRPDLFEKKFWACLDCSAWVGCHPGTERALGRLANARLRKLKSATHAVFDPLWKSGRMSRGAAYAYLAGLLNIEVEDCHVGMFDEMTCLAAIKYLGPYGASKS